MSCFWFLFHNWVYIDAPKAAAWKRLCLKCGKGANWTPDYLASGGWQNQDGTIH